MLYREKDRDGKLINFLDTVISSSIQLIPNKKSRIFLEQDYKYMVESKMIYGNVKSFNQVMESCLRIESVNNRKPR